MEPRGVFGWGAWPSVSVIAGSWWRDRRSMGGVGSGMESRVIVLWASTLQVEGGLRSSWVRQWCFICLEGQFWVGRGSSVEKSQRWERGSEAVAWEWIVIEVGETGRSGSSTCRVPLTPAAVLRTWGYEDGLAETGSLPSRRLWVRWEVSMSAHYNMCNKSRMNRAEKCGGESDQLCWEMGWQSGKPPESVHGVTEEGESRTRVSLASLAFSRLLTLLRPVS